MASLKEVKNRISSVQNTQQITKAMKMVAASKLKKAQDRLMQMRPYAEKLDKIIQNVTAGVEDISLDYAQERPVERVIVVVISSDKGLCGPFNGNIFKKAKRHIDQNYKQVEQNGQLQIMTVGSKGYDHFKKRNYKVIDDFKDLYADASFSNVRKAAEYLMEAFLNNEVDRVDLVYNEFKNVASQIQRADQFLPLTSLSEEGASDKDENLDYIFEPSVDFIIEELIPQSLKTRFYKAYLESGAAEQGARMTAMDQATDNADELLKDLRLTYNRTRQAVITKELSEIVGGADALEG